MWYIGKYDFVFSQGNIASRLAVLIAGLMGGYLGSVNLALPFLVGSIISLLGFVIGLFLIEENFVRPKKLNFKLISARISGIARESIDYGLRHKIIFWLLLSSFLMMAAYMPLNMFWQPRFNQLAGNQIWILGWVWAGFSLMMMLGSYVLQKIKTKNLFLPFLISIFFLSIPILLISKLAIFLPVFIGFMVHEVGRGMQVPLHKAYINRFIPAEKRATILSFDS
ncbi:MAG: High-affinity glucose transporter SNF3, partial [Parcubacteria group bacterium GW2011_GWF2_40_10]